MNLIKASESGNLNKVKELVENGADIHADDDDALRLAALYGHLEVVKYLVENGADIHDALRLAAVYGQLEVVKYLVENGADIHAGDDVALRWAAVNGHLKVVNYLRSVTGKRWNCHNCLIRATCVSLCKDFRNGVE